MESSNDVIKQRAYSTICSLLHQIEAQTSILLYMCYAIVFIHVNSKCMLVIMFYIIPNILNVIYRMNCVHLCGL